MLVVKIIYAAFWVWLLSLFFVLLGILWESRKNKMQESERISAKDLKYIQAASEIKVNRFFPVYEAMNALIRLWGETSEGFDLSDIDQMIDSDEKTKTQDAEPEEVELDFEIEEDQELSDESIPDDVLDEIEEEPELLCELMLDDVLDEDDFSPELELNDVVEYSYEEDVEKNWFIGLSREFKKSVKKVDKKVKGRILEAIEQISTSPVKQKGDVIKPLSAKLKGLWRYRVGDYRLVYKPDSKNRTVTLVVFSPRGSAYQQ